MAAHRRSRGSERFNASALISVAILFLFLIYQYAVSPPPPPPEQPSQTSTHDLPPPQTALGFVPRDAHVPEVWRHLGAASFAHLAGLASRTPRRDALSALSDHYLAPWSAPTADLATRPPVSAALIDSMEGPLRACTARIRLSGDGRVLYRVLTHWEKTYRVPRLVFFLDLLARMLKRHPQLRILHAEFYLNTADGPHATLDSMSQEWGALPVFSFRSAAHYIDIPVPDPVEHGAKVTGAGYTLPDGFVAPVWAQRTPRLVFRGVASCIQHMRAGNWHLNPRVRAAIISAANPDLLDIGVSKWIKLTNGTTPEDVERDANISAKAPLSLAEQLGFRYILDIDGGLGSSRKRWMLRSGSLPFFQRSAVFQWYEPLLVPWLHFIPVDRWFRDLVELVRWARGHDAAARDVVKSAEKFAEDYLSDGALLDYLAVLLQKYAELQPDARHGNTSVPDACGQFPNVEHGPMGCGTGWFEHVRDAPAAFGCRHKPEVEGSFVCHRPHPRTGRKQVKHGTDTPYANDPELEIPRPARPGDKIQDRLIV